MAANFLAEPLALTLEALEVLKSGSCNQGMIGIGCFFLVALVLRREGKLRLL